MILVARAYDTGINLGADRYCAWLSKLPGGTSLRQGWGNDFSAFVF